jgi:AraC-like DNA-binding protein
MLLSEDLYERIINAKLFIDENFGDDINLDSVARQACLSRFHFHRLFSHVYKRTPHQYITFKRLERAKHLLADNKPVTEVCNEIGFESLGSFSSLFKKQSGLAPQYYRNLAWLKKQKAKEQPKAFVPHCFIHSYKLDQ